MYKRQPSSEVTETVAQLRASGAAQGIHVEWSTNEKSALELLAGDVYKRQLPENAKSYVEYLEQKVGVPISIVAVGPDRDQTIMRGW